MKKVMPQDLLAPESYMMTVKDLKGILDSLNDDLYVVLSKDSEGNSYSPLTCTGSISEGVFVRYHNWSGDFYDADDEREKDPQEIPVVVLWPVN